MPRGSKWISALVSCRGDQWPDTTYPAHLPLRVVRKGAALAFIIDEYDRSIRALARVTGRSELPVPSRW